MAVLTDATIWLDGLDIQTISNRVTVSQECETQDATTFGDSVRGYKAGLYVVSANVDYYVDWDTTGSTLWDSVGAASGVLTVTPTGADGATGYSFQQITQVNNPFGGEVGSMNPGTLGMQGRAGTPLVGGKLLYPKQTVTGADSGTAVQMGAVSADEKVYTAIHVFTAGTTADVIVESDDQENFGGTPTSRSSTTVTATGSTWVTPVDGAITDDWWRVRTANVTGTFVVGVVVAIQ